MADAIHPQRRANREEAFVYWYADGDRRSAAEVAEHYGVSQRAVEQWVSEEDWVARGQRLDLAARQKAEAELVKGLARRLRLQHGAVEAGLAQYIRNVQAGNIILTPADALAWAKHGVVLDGGVSDRTTTVSSERDAERQQVVESIATELLDTDPAQLAQDEEDLP